MDKDVLVAYATKHGGTAEIAAHISEILHQHGLNAETRDLANSLRPDGYAAVVLGSAVYFGQWRKEAIRFLEDNEQTLSAMPVWLFASGPTGEGDPVELMEGWEIPGGLRPLVERLQPVDSTVFHGTIEPDSLNFLERFTIKNVKSPVGDFRDWDAITEWAEGIAEALEKRPSEQSA